MNSLKSIAIAATIAFAGLASVSTAQASERQWGGSPQSWSSPTVSQCTLQVQKVFQPNQGQPLHLVVKNTSKVRLQYTIKARVIRGGKEEFAGQIMVDNANAGEVSERPTPNAYKATLDGTVVMLSLVSCSLRN